MLGTWHNASTGDMAYIDDAVSSLGDDSSNQIHATGATLFAHLRNLFLNVQNHTKVYNGMREINIGRQTTWVNLSKSLAWRLHFLCSYSVNCLVFASSFLQNDQEGAGFVQGTARHKSITAGLRAEVLCRCGDGWVAYRRPAVASSACGRGCALSLLLHSFVTFSDCKKKIEHHIFFQFPAYYAHRSKFDPAVMLKQ